MAVSALGTAAIFAGKVPNFSGSYGEHFAITGCLCPILLHNL
jgi:hypothetical protein